MVIGYWLLVIEINRLASKVFIALGRSANSKGKSSRLNREDESTEKGKCLKADDRLPKGILSFA